MAIKDQTPHVFFTSIKKEHMDLFGHVNHAKYLEIFEDARWDLITQGGYGTKEIKANQMGPVILEATVRYKKELVSGDEIKICTYTEHHAKKIGKIYQEMFSAKTNDLHATIDIVYGLMDMKERKLINPTPEWLHAISNLKTN